jgi:ATP-dependent Lon protease
MTETRLDLPLLPLRDTVILPTMMVPLFIGRRKSVAAVEQALAGDGTIFLAAQRNGQLINPEKEDLFPFGCVGEITDRVQLPDKSIKVMVEGRQRARVLDVLEVEPSFVCRVATLAPAPDDLEASQARYPSLLERFKALAGISRRIPPEALRPFETPDDVSAAVDMMIATLSLRFQDRQDLLEMTRLIERVERVSELVAKEAEAVEAEQRVRARQRPQAPQKRKIVPPGRETGPSSPDAAQQAEAADEFKNELAELEEKLAKKAMPDYARERGRRELKKLRMMSPMSAEATVVRNYLDWVVGLPWDEVTKDKLDIADAEKVLDEDHHGLEKVKERILEYLAVQELVKEVRGPILCFVGPPGVGKTSLARSIARATGRTYVRLSLGGVRDEAEIRGHRRTYIGAFPGKIIQSLKRAGSSNPVLLLDEVDKMSADFRGDPAAALLEVLDPEQNGSFLDHYLDVDYDLSRVLFITTANNMHGIPAPLLDRMEVIQLPGYTELEKVQIARQFLFPKQRKENGLADVDVRLPEGTLKFLVNGYTREAGVRNLERELGAVLRKIAVDVVRGGATKGRAYRVTPAMVKGFLGEPRFRDSKADDHDEVGAATGLAVTYAGGDILAIEVTLMPGSGKLTITGKLGDVMQESAHAAMSYVRAHAAGLGLDRAFYQKIDVHIHVPEGAIPKDGPSAGITIATALASAVARVPVRRDVAMTGEITLRGRVLPIGGVKEKLLAANRSGYTTVIVPSENLKDLKDVPKAVRASLDIVLASTMDDVLKRALVADPRITFPLAASQSDLDQELRGKPTAATRRRTRT